MWLASMSLSAYALHLVGMAILDPATGGGDWYSGTAGAAFCLGLVVTAVLWRSWCRQGPLERLVACVVDRTVARARRIVT